MDKKIILSILIVALIGIVAATYQINIGDTALNPLTSVISGDTPVTDALEAPSSSGDSSNTGSNVAQKQIAKDQANSQSKVNGTSQSDTNNSQSSSNSGSSLINSENPVNTSGNQGTNNDGNNQANQGTNNNGNNQANQGTNNDGNNQANQGTNNNGNNQANQGTNNNGNNQANQGTNNNGNNQGSRSDTSDNSKSDISASDISLVQANTLIKTLHINDNLNIDISSVTTVTDNDGNTWYKYQATYKDNPNEKINVYYPKNRLKSSPYVYEEGSGQDVSNDNTNYGDEVYLNTSG